MSWMLCLQLLLGGSILFQLMISAQSRSVPPKTFICKLNNLPIRNQVLKGLSLKPTNITVHNRPVFDVEITSSSDVLMFYGNQSNELNTPVWIISYRLRNSVTDCVAYINSTAKHPSAIKGTWRVHEETKRTSTPKEPIKVECIPGPKEGHTSDAASVVQALAAVGIVVIIFILRILIRDKKPVNIYRISKNTTRVFDVFICYANGGTGKDFACDALYRKLKDEWGLNVAIDNRNCIPGESKGRSIQRCIEGSRNIILVLTRDFLDSSWCQMESASALCQMVNRSSRIVPLLLEDIRKSHNLEHELRHIIETKGFLKVPAAQDKRRSKRFWMILKRLLHPEEVFAPSTIEADEGIFVLPQQEPELELPVLTGSHVVEMEESLRDLFATKL